MKYNVTFELNEKQDAAMRVGVARDGFESVEAFCATNMATVADSFIAQQGESDQEAMLRAYKLKDQMLEPDKAKVESAVVALIEAAATMIPIEEDEQ